MADIKAISIDIDGTITDNQRRLCLNSIEALRGCEEKGFPVMLASGNIMASTVTLGKLLGFTGPMIAENGGIVHFRGETKTLGDKEVCLKALEHVKQKTPVRELFTNQCRLTEVCLVEDVDIENIRDLLKDHPVDVNKTGFAIHIMSKGTDKFKALTRGCELLGIGTEEVMAIGDSENDIEMIKGSGIGVAVSNALEELKNSADYVCKDPFGDGVIEALEHFKII